MNTVTGFYIDIRLLKIEIGHGLDGIASRQNLSKREQGETDVDYRSRLFSEVKEILAKTN